MIFEIFSDISAFMIILVISLVAYAQVTLIFSTLEPKDPLKEAIDVESHLRRSYLLTLGDFDEPEKTTTT